MSASGDGSTRPATGWTNREALEAFETAWESGERPRVEDYLAGAHLDRRALLFDLVRVDLAFRRKSGEPALVMEYVDRFPELKSDREALLALVQTEDGRRKVRRETEQATLPHLGNAEVSGSETETSGSDAVPGGMPARVGIYRVEEEMARGGMGRIFRVRDDNFDRPLAMKVLIETSRAPADRFLREARLTALLQHPGIAPVHDLGRLDDGRPYFVMKLVQGRSLKALLKDRASPADELPKFIAIFEQICQTVGYAHARDVIHRDLKPANIMVGAFGEVQVMDWGLAKVLNTPFAEEPTSWEDDSTVVDLRDSGATAERTIVGTALGTPSYMAPEQARGDIETVDRRTDVFGLGAILCEILTGRPPFTGHDRQEVMDKSAREELAAVCARLAICGADAELIGIARRCLEPRPENRPPDGSAVAAAVTSYQAELIRRLHQAEIDRAAAAARAHEEERRRAAEQARADAEHAKARSERTRRRTTLALAATLLLLLLGAAAAGWGYLSYEAEQERLSREGQEEATRRRREAERHSDNVRLSAEAQKKLALSEIHAGRFDSAASILQVASEDLRTEPKLEPLLAEFSSLHEHVRWLIDFYHSADEVERLAFEMQFDESLDLGGNGLKKLGLLSHPQWWQHLPDTDLLPYQQEKLKHDIYRILHLVGAMRAYDAAKNLFSPKAAPSFRSAIELMEHAERFRPSRAAQMLKNWCYFGLGEFRRIQPLGPGEPETSTDYYLMGMANLGLKFMGDHPITTWIVASPLNLIAGLDRKDPHGSGLDHLRMALRMEPRQYFTYIFLARVLSHEDKVQEAEAVLNSCIALRPNYEIGYLNRGSMILRQVERATSLERINQLLGRALADGETARRLNPNLLHVQGFLGDVYRACGDYDKAIARYNQFLSAPSAEAALYYTHRSIAHRLKGDAVQAVADVTKALQLASQKDNVHHHELPRYFHIRALAHLAEKNFDKALEDVNQAIRLAPRTAVLLTARATCYRLQEDGKALAEVKKALQLSPNYAEAHALLGLIYFAGSDFDPAIKEIEEAARLNPAGPYRYQGVCALLSAMAAPAKTTTAGKIDPARLRQRALKWLEADVAAWSKVIARDAPLNALARHKFRLWQRSPELASVREFQELARLVEDERAAWTRLWSEVDALCLRAATTTDVRMSPADAGGDSGELTKLRSR